MMSSTDTSDDHAMADSAPSVVQGGLDTNYSLQRSLATYRYENALIKTELSAALERHAREVEELRLRYQSQVKEVERQRMEAESQVSEIQDAQIEKQRKLQQANVQFQQKIKVMEEDLEVVTKAHDKLVKEKAQAEEDQQQRILSLQTALQSIKGEKVQLVETVDLLRSDLNKEKITVQELTTTLNSEKHQQQLIESRLSEVEQHCQVQLAAAKAEASRLREDREQNVATTAKRIKELMNMIDEEKEVATKVKERAAAKELELEKCIAEERRLHLSRSNQLAQQNSQLQDHIKVLETKIKSSEEKRDTRVSDLQLEVQQVTEKLYCIEREKVVLEAKVASLESMEGVLRREREDCSMLRQELHQQQAEAQELKTYNSDLQQQCQQLKNNLSDAKSQQDVMKEEVKKERDIGNRLMADQRASHQEELEQLRIRISTLETRLVEKNRNYLEECNQLKQKVHTYGKLIKKLRFKLEIGEVQVEQLEAQRAALQDNVPGHVYRNLENQLQDITRKHNEFAAYIRGLNEFHSSLPEITELTAHVGAVGQKLSELDEDQLQCLSDLQSL